MNLLLLYFFSAILVSFLCSLMESTLLSTQRPFVEILVNKNSRRGKVLSELLDNIERPLAAILTLNTIANTIGAAGVGSQVQIIWGNQYVAFASGLLTLFILIFSEIIPKTLGTHYWKTFAPLLAPVYSILIWLGLPFVIISDILSRFIGDPEPETVSRQEVIMTAELSAEEGRIEHGESKIIKNLLMLDSFYVQDIMTPRSVLMALDKNLAVEEVMRTFRPIHFSRIPIFNDEIDKVVGMVHRYKILEASSSDHHQMTMGELAGPIQFVSPLMPVGDLLDQFIKQRQHVYLVRDAQMKILGLVSLEDAIETLLGTEIVDEFDTVEDLRKFALEQWRQKKARSTRWSNFE